MAFVIDRSLLQTAQRCFDFEGRVATSSEINGKTGDKFYRFVGMTM